MKALFLGLLLANTLMFVWSLWHAPSAQPAGDSRATSVPRLQLASEAQTPIAAAPIAAAPMAGAPRRAADEEGSTPPEPERAPEDAPAAASTIAAATPSPGAVELPAAVARCVSIGPFRDLSETTQASATLREGSFEPRTRVAEGDVWAGLWVYLEDLPSRDEAQRAMTLLKRRGISDAYIMPSADQTNDISLGVFSDPEGAQRRAEDVRALGFTPTTTDRTRRGRVYWIDIDLKSTDADINPTDLQSESGRIVRLEVLPCAPESRSNSG